MTDSNTANSLALDLSLNDAKLESALAAARAVAVEKEWADRAIGRRDPSVWSDDEVVKRAVATRLGWLEAPFHFADEAAELKAFAAALRAGLHHRGPGRHGRQQPRSGSPDPRLRHGRGRHARPRP